jgi:signal transduction histidine kinase
MVALFLLHGMLMAGMGAVTALFFMVPYTFAGMLLSGQRRMWVQGVCVAAFWLSLMYGIIPFAPQLHPPLIFSVCYNLLLAAFTFQTLRFLNQLAVEINTIYVAEQMRQQSRQFLMSVSHELRTPLNSVLGFARMLKKSELDETQSSYLNLIINEGDQLNRLVSDLLDSARLLSGKHELHLQACAINPICEAVAAEHLPVVKSGVALHIDLASDLPMINGDPVRLRQALGNLVSNAVKFTEQGEIVIRTYSHGKSICIAVTDTGPGIPDDQQKLIFVPFVRLDHKTPGVGLGLDIALQLVRLHGGDIRLYSVLGQGSTFTIELPTL